MNKYSRKSVIVGLFFLLTFLFACNYSEFRGYKEIEEDVYIRLLSIGDGNQRITKGDYVTLDLRYSTLEDSLLFNGLRRFAVSEDYDSPFSNAICNFSEGDSGSVILPVELFFEKTLHKNTPASIRKFNFLKISFKVIEVQSHFEFDQQKKMFLRWVKEFQGSEYEQISRYLNEQDFNIPKRSSGLYFLSLKDGYGPKVGKGRHVFIQYEGRFLNGKFLESTITRREPIDFIYGQELIVVKGMEEAIGLMREGQKALIILPSGLAFGSEGVGNGIVPPFSTLIYEVEVLKVE